MLIDSPFYAHPLLVFSEVLTQKFFINTVVMAAINNNFDNNKKKCEESEMSI